MAPLPLLWAPVPISSMFSCQHSLLFTIFPKQVPVMYRYPDAPANGVLPDHATVQRIVTGTLVLPAPLLSSWAFAGAVAAADGTGGAALTALTVVVADTAAAVGAAEGASAGAGAAAPAAAPSHSCCGGLSKSTRRDCCCCCCGVLRQTIT